MPFTKEIETNVTVLNDGRLQVLDTTVVFEDDIEIARSNHRHVVEAGADTTGMSQLTIEVAAAVHTPARIAARQVIIAQEAAAAGANANPN